VGVLPSRTPLRTLREMTPTLDFVLPGLVRGTVGAFVSPGGVGKSYWMLSAALAISCKIKRAGGCTPLAERIDQLGFPVSQGKVVLFAAEDAQEIIALRAQAMLGEVQLNDEDFEYIDCAGLNVDLMVDEWFSQLLAASRGARLVILDTISRFHALDENSTSDAKLLMAQLERLARESGAAVVYVHHTSKNAALAGAGAMQQAARGSSVLVDNARWAAFLAPMTDVEASRFAIEGSPARYVRWNVSKQNYGAPLEDIWYERQACGVLQAVRMKPRRTVTMQHPPVIMAQAQAPAPEREQVPLAAAAPVEVPPTPAAPTARGAYGGEW